MNLEPRMKLYEHNYTSERLIPLLPTFARIDGRTFHSFTRDLDRPFDKKFALLMQGTAGYLLKESGAHISYTQSDEITLMWYYPDFRSQMFFGGKCFKLTSVLASMAAAYFNKYVPYFLPTKIDEIANFDCRVWQVPDLYEAANVFLWREIDATRNGIQMLARSVYSHKELLNKNIIKCKAMLAAKNIFINNYANHFERGTYLSTRQDLLEKFGLKEFDEDLEIRFPFLKSIGNLKNVLFDGADPIERTDDVSMAEE